MPDAYTNKEHRKQSPEMEIINTWLEKRRRERWLITLLWFAAAMGIVFLAYRYGGNKALLPALLGIVVMVIVHRILLLLHDKIVLRRLEAKHPELWDAEAQYNDYSPLSRMQYYNQSQKKTFGCSGVVLVVLCAAVALGIHTFADVYAIAKVQTLNKKAETVLITANTWRTQQKEAGNPTDLYTVIVNYDDEYAEGSLEDALQDTLYTDSMYIRNGSKITRVSRSEAEGGCAIVCDTDGKVLYAFWSETPLTEEDLVPLDYDTQYEQESSLFGEGTVGWYAPE